MCPVFRTSSNDNVSRQRTVNLVYLIYCVMLEVQGIVTLALAIWMETGNISACAFLRGYFSPIHVMLGAGLLVILFTIGGAILVFKFNIKNSMRQFVLILGVVVLLELVALVLSTVYENRIRDTDLLDELMDSKGSVVSQGQGYQECWVELQPAYTCCGIHGLTDWVNHKTNSSNSPRDVLDACVCDASDNACVTWNNRTFFLDGCHDALADTLNQSYTIVRAYLTVCVLLQCVGYIIMYSIFVKLNQKAKIDVYRPEQSKVPIMQESHM